MPTQYTTSSTMRQLIEGFEGCRLVPYQDSVGVWTIGFGHTGDDTYEGCDPISQEIADQLLSNDLKAFEDGINQMTIDATSQQQFDALVSFAYNLGESALRGSTLLRMHNSQDYNGAAGQFARWNHAGGRELPGLTRRRAAEAAVYANGDYGGPEAA